MCLTGNMMDADEAERCGLVSRIVAADDLIDEAIAVASAEKSRPSVFTAKECVNTAYETGLKEGVHYERRVFHSFLPLTISLKAWPLLLKSGAAQIQQ